jgi:hypothetical protein
MFDNDFDVKQNFNHRLNLNAELVGVNADDGTFIFYQLIKWNCAIFTCKYFFTYSKRKANGMLSELP